MVKWGMLKTRALELLGGSREAARQIGVTYQAVEKWPDELPPRIADRVVAALARQHLSLKKLGLEDNTTRPAPAAKTQA